MSSWSADISPFIFEGTVPPGRLIGRHEEIASLLAWARAGRNVALIGPLRYGKTSLLDAVADRADRARGTDRLLPVMVDLYGVLGLVDVVLRLEAAWQRAASTRTRLQDAVARVFAGAQLGLNIAGAGFQVRLAQDPRTDPLPALHTLLDLPITLHGRRGHPRVLLVLDEFQDLAGVQGAEAILRSHSQHQRAAASYVFSGSEPSMLAAAFGDAARPFYGQAEVKRLGRLPHDLLAETVSERFAATDRSPGPVLSDLVSASAGHPQRAMLLAHELWSEVPPGGRADVASWTTARERADRRAADQMVALWSGLNRSEQRTLRAIVDFGSPYRVDAAQTLGLAKASAQSAVRQLLGRGLLEADASRALQLVDPLLARWIARHTRQRPPP